MDPFATHLAPLVRAALACDGPILELGCGDYSTPALAEIARHKGTTLTVMSSSPAWAMKFRAIASIVHVSDWQSVEFSGWWGMVLLDNEELTANRIRHLPALANVTGCVVVHDLEACETHAHWNDMIEPFANLERFTAYQPGTGVLTC